MSSIPTPSGRSRLPAPASVSRLPGPSAKRLASVDLEQGQGEAKKKKLEKGDSSSSLPETNPNGGINKMNKFTVGRAGPTKPPGRLPNSMMSGRATTVGARSAAPSVSAARDRNQ